VTEVDKDVYIPPVPEHITLAINCPLDEPTKSSMQVKMLDVLAPDFTEFINIIRLLIKKFAEWLEEKHHALRFSLTSFTVILSFTCAIMIYGSPRAKGRFRLVKLGGLSGVA